MPSIVFLLGILLEVTIFDHDLNEIFQINEVLHSVSMDLVESTVFGFVRVGLGGCLSIKMDPGLLELCIAHLDNIFSLEATSSV